jgi:hypothetical protein
MRRRDGYDAERGIAHRKQKRLEIDRRDSTQRSRHFRPTHNSRPLNRIPVRSRNYFCAERQGVGIEQKNLGQCDCGAGMFESIQIKTILKSQFEIVQDHI